MSLEYVLFIMFGVPLAACIAYVARSEIRLMRDLSARMAARGFASGASSPQLKPHDLRFDGRVGWRGKVAGHEATVYELRPERRLLGELSPADIIDTLRSAVGRRRELGFD